MNDEFLEWLDKQIKSMHGAIKVFTLAEKEGRLDTVEVRRTIAMYLAGLIYIQNRYLEYLKEKANG